MATKKGVKDHHHEHKHDREELLNKMEADLDDKELEYLYSWVDSIPLSRPKRNIARDFSDGVLVAEIIKHFFPHEGLVELHNYTTANATPKKKENWYYLNRKVFSKMNFELAPDVIDDLVTCKQGMIEKVLLMLQVKIKRAEYARQRQNDKPEADQHQSPGRKDGRMLKVGMEDTKGSKFVKTKQHQQLPPQGKSPSKNPQSNAIPKKRVGEVVESSMVPRYLLEEKQQDVLARDETIQMLHKKIMKLEYLLQLKDRRLAELHHQIEHLQGQQQQHQQQQHQHQHQYEHDDHHQHHDDHRHHHH